MSLLGNEGLARDPWALGISLLAGSLAALLAYVHSVGRGSIYAQLFFLLLSIYLLFMSARLALLARRKRTMSSSLQAIDIVVHSVLDILPGLIFIADAKGRVQYVNSALRAFTGNSVQNLLRDGRFAQIYPEDEREVREKLTDCARLEEPFGFAFRQLHHDGEYRQFEAIMRCQKDESGKVLRWYGVLTEVDARTLKNETARLRQAEAGGNGSSPSLNEMVSAISPEITQPLTAIMINGQACLRFLSTDPINLPGAVSTVRRIIRDGRDITRILKDVNSAVFDG